MLYLLRMAVSAARPRRRRQARELAGLAAKLEGMYGKGKYCGKGRQGRAPRPEKLSKVMRESRNWDELLDAWAGWHTISRPMRPLFAEEVELANTGARSSASRTPATCGARPTT